MGTSTYYIVMIDELFLGNSLFLTESTSDYVMKVTTK